MVNVERAGFLCAQGKLADGFRLTHMLVPDVLPQGVEERGCCTRVMVFRNFCKLVTQEEHV